MHAICSLLIFMLHPPAWVNFDNVLGMVLGQAYEADGDPGRERLFWAWDRGY